MANISKTFIFPVPTAWLGQDQDDANVGVATYNGPAKLIVWFDKVNAGVGGTFEDAANKTSRLKFAHDASDPAIIGRNPPIDAYAVELDADVYPMHAAALFGGTCIAKPDYIEVVAGPSSDPNPKIQDPAHFHEVYNMSSFTYDPTLNSGAGGWSTPRFSAAGITSEAYGVDTSDLVTEDFTFGWEWVRRSRNAKLAGSDTKIPEDAPEELKNRWKNYRTKLRNLPQDWAGVGTATHLIVWPQDPNEEDNWNHIQTYQKDHDVDEGGSVNTQST